MQTLEIKIPVQVLQYAELSASDKLLVDAAKQASAAAMAPYSHFNVGAAILLADGSVVCGSNQENAAFPSSMCAERTAAYWASAHHPGVAMRKIAVAANTYNLHRRPGASYSDSFQPHPIAPCGACRQALLEYENRFGPMQVILFGAEKIYILPSVASLLPVTFTDF